MSRRRTVQAACAAGVAALALAGCSGGANEQPVGEPAPATTTETTTEQATTTEPAVEPVTAGEKRWLRQVQRYARRLERTRLRAGTVTHLTMRREARVYAECRSTLKHAGDPGRFGSAYGIVERGCDRLHRAAELLEVAIASSGAGGTVVEGTPEAARFEQAFNGSIEAAGNAQFDLQRALERAERVQADIDEQSS